MERQMNSERTRQRTDGAAECGSGVVDIQLTWPAATHSLSPLLLRVHLSTDHSHFRRSRNTLPL